MSASPWPLLRRRECLVPTWRGWLLLVGAFLALFYVCVHQIYHFLAPSHPLPGGVLVVEGWAPDYAFRVAMDEFRTNHYERVYVTGGPVEFGSFLSEYRTYAERGTAVLVNLGLNTNAVQAVPAPRSQQDRTYTSATTLRDWWREHSLAPAKVHLLTVGTHARRSRLFYQKALGKNVSVGVTAIPDQNYDPRHWWRYSAGVRGVIDETIAYIYAKWFFRARGE